MKVAFIHNERNRATGAHYINSLISQKLSQLGVDMRHFYPRYRLNDTPVNLGGLKNILYFHGLLEHRDEMLRCDIIQGTTYTPLALLSFSRPVVSHFGSTTRGFLDATPRNYQLEPELQAVWVELRQANVISKLNLETRRPLRDIAEIEKFVASRAAGVVATSAGVSRELIEQGVNPANIRIIHNAIEDLWFDNQPAELLPPELVYIGRLGSDVFTLRLKGLDRLVAIERALPLIPKLTIVMTSNRRLVSWLRHTTANSLVRTNLFKEDIRDLIARRYGSIIFVTSRYEGFCLSMVEGMSQGLIPIAYPVGVAPEIIRDGDNGYLVRSTAEAIQRSRQILADESLRAKLAANAQATAAQFRADAMAHQLLNFYREIVARNPKSTRRSRRNRAHRRVGR